METALADAQRIGPATSLIRELLARVIPLSSFVAGCPP